MFLRFVRWRFPTAVMRVWRGGGMVEDCMLAAVAPTLAALARVAGETPAGGAAAPSGVLGAWLALGATAWVLPAISFAIQVACIVHVVRRREDYGWIFLILFFPVVGSLVYILAIVWPDWRRRPRRRCGGAGVFGIASTRRRLKALEQQVSLSGTVDDRAELAAAYADAGEYSLSRQCYEVCLQGPNASDPHLLLGMIRACSGEGQFERCLECASRIDRREIPERVKELDLLQAKAMMALGRDQDGIALLRTLAPRATGLEAWWRLAEALARCGDERGAEDACRRLLDAAMGLGPASRKRDKPWIALARDRLRART